MQENMVVIRKSKAFCFDFDFPKDVNNLKHKIEIIIKT